jgi:hypothetical protein
MDPGRARRLLEVGLPSLLENEHSWSSRYERAKASDSWDHALKDPELYKWAKLQLVLAEFDQLSTDRQLKLEAMIGFWGKSEKSAAKLSRPGQMSDETKCVLPSAEQGAATATKPSAAPTIPVTNAIKQTVAKGDEHVVSHAAVVTDEEVMATAEAIVTRLVPCESENLVGAAAVATITPQTACTAEQPDVTLNSMDDDTAAGGRVLDERSTNLDANVEVLGSEAATMKTEDHTIPIPVSEAAAASGTSPISNGTGKTIGRRSRTSTPAPSTLNTRSKASCSKRQRKEGPRSR